MAEPKGVGLAQAAAKGSPTFLRHQSLLHSNPASPPPISNFESFKLRSRLLKAHLSAAAAEECVSELARFGIETEADLSRLKLNIIEQLRVRPKVRAILKEMRFVHAEAFRLEDLLKESTLFDKPTSEESAANCARLGTLIRDNLGVKRWRDFQCIVGTDLIDIGFTDEERHALMSIVKFAKDFNRKTLLTQLDELRRNLSQAVEIYSELTASISEVERFLGPGVPIDIFPDELAAIKQSMLHAKVEAFAAMDKHNPDSDRVTVAEEPVTTDGSDSSAALVAVSDASKWKVENEANNTSFRNQIKALTILNSQNERMYRRMFYEQVDHVNFYGESSVTEPKRSQGSDALTSGFYDDEDTKSLILISAEKRKTGTSRVLVRTAAGDELLAVPAVSHGRDMIDVLKKTFPDKLAHYELKKVKENKAEFQDSLARMDDYLLTDKYKFGIIYVKSGQQNEQEFLSNTNGSKEYDEFLNMIGNRINLAGWSKFAAGLDVRQNRTGSTSVFTEFESKEIMFHVATLMPTYESEDLRLEKKRHVGNDVVAIVFVDNGMQFDPAWLKTKFTQVFLVVSPVKRNNRTYFRMQVVTRDTIGSFGPAMPPCLFPLSQDTRAFVLTKLINSERAAMETQLFSEKTHRARQGIIHDLIVQHRARSTGKNKLLAFPSNMSKKGKVLRKELSSKQIDRPTAVASRVQRRPSLGSLDLAMPVKFASASSSLESSPLTSPTSALKPSSSASSLAPSVDSSKSAISPQASPRGATKSSAGDKEKASSTLSPEHAEKEKDKEKKKSKHRRQKSHASVELEDSV